MVERDPHAPSASPMEGEEGFVPNERVSMAESDLSRWVTPRAFGVSFAFLSQLAPMAMLSMFADDTDEVRGGRAALERGGALSATSSEGVVDVDGIASGEDDGDTRRYNEVSFAATHNSYAGPLSGGNVPSIRAQLDAGVRFIELDVHNESFRNLGFRVGHKAPGDLVFHGGGNPRGDSLDEWLRLIAQWSNENPRHAPITVALDIKDSLAESRSFKDGDIGALNERVAAIFGRKLFSAAERDLEPWPAIGAIRGRILVVLSGDEETRVAYRGDRARQPAIAMNDAGKVVEVHDTGDGRLWYWAGEYLDSGFVRWRRHNFYDTGKNPSIDINNDGLVVEIHEDPDAGDDQLWYRVGHLDRDLEIRWLRVQGLAFPAADEGLDPRVRFVSREGNEVREVHRRPWTRSRWFRNGIFDPASAMIVWSQDARVEGATTDRIARKSLAAAGSRSVEVFTGIDGGFGSDTLLYSTDRNGPLRIRYAQLAFVEVQHGNNSELGNDGLLFYAGPAAEVSARTWAAAWRAAGKVSRLWRFNDAALTNESAVNFPATDLPFSRWYRGYRGTLDCAR